MPPASNDPATRTCPECGEPAEWVEQLPGRIEYGCVNHHTWRVEK